MTRKYFSLLLAIGLILCFLTACPDEEPFVPPGDGTYEPKLASVTGWTLNCTGFMEYVGSSMAFSREDVNGDIPQEKTFLLDGVEYRTTLVGNEEEIYYVTDDGKYRFYVYHDAQLSRVENTAVDYTPPLTVTREEFVAKAQALLQEMIGDISPYEPVVDVDDRGCTVEMVKYIDGYPTYDMAHFSFSGNGDIRFIRCPYLRKLQNTENVPYDLEMGRKAVSSVMEQVLKNSDDVTRSDPYEITFEKFAVMKDGRLALQYRVSHTYMKKGSMLQKYDAAYTIYVPIAA
ncbi:MAG: hypothetical protein IJ012_07465 [Clostridia bacterium]|nr:hypothetical protein [Clostridia bacterium]